MSYSEERWRAYVLAYDVEVAQEDVEEELYRVRADMKHRMIYAQMTGAESHPFPEMELEGQKDALVEAALFEAKEPLVLKDLTRKLDVTVTPEELLALSKAEGYELSDEELEAVSGGGAWEHVEHFLDHDCSGD